LDSFSVRSWCKWTSRDAKKHAVMCISAGKYFF
jgi:hypothetical protein